MRSSRSQPVETQAVDGPVLETEPVPEGRLDEDGLEPVAYEYEPSGYETSEYVEEPAAPGHVAPRSGGMLADALRPGPLALLLAVIAFLAAGGIGAAVARSGSVAYGSNVVLSIDQPLVIAASRDAGPIDKLNRLRLQYAALVKTAVVADQIASRTGRTAGDVSSSLDVLPAQNSLLIVLTGRGKDRSAAVQLAGQAATALIDYAARSQASAGVPVAQRVTLTVVTPAGAPTAITRSTRSVATVALALGLVAAAAVYVLVSLLSSLRRR